jgi:hypothetical protein
MTVVELVSDLDLSDTEIEFLYPLLMQYKKIAYNKDTKVILIEANKLWEREEIYDSIKFFIRSVEKIHDSNVDTSTTT